MARKNDRYITGLDIGTHKVCAIIAEAMDDRRLNVVGAAHTESMGAATTSDETKFAACDVRSMLLSSAAPVVRVRSTRSAGPFCTGGALAPLEAHAERHSAARPAASERGVLDMRSY